MRTYLLVLLLLVVGAWIVHLAMRSNRRRQAERDDMAAMVRGRGRHRPPEIQRHPPRPLVNDALESHRRQVVSMRTGSAAEARRAEARKPAIKGAPGGKRCTLRLRYTDASGERTERDVAPYKTGATRYGFDAWCALRGGRRSFVFSRIDGGVNLETGEVLDAFGVFALIHPTRKVPAEFDVY